MLMLMVHIAWLHDSWVQDTDPGKLCWSTLDVHMQQ